MRNASCWLFRWRSLLALPVGRFRGRPHLHADEMFAVALSPATFYLRSPSAFTSK
jgi:hypothetical protein